MSFLPLVVLHMVAMEVRINYITQEGRRPTSKPSGAPNDFNYSIPSNFLEDRIYFFDHYNFWPCFWSWDVFFTVILLFKKEAMDRDSMDIGIMELY